MEEAGLLAQIQGLNDLELAVLLCLVAEEHCIIRSDPGEIASARAELQQVIL
jgi:hypothetical protein